MAHGPLYILSLLLFSQYNLNSILTQLFNSLLKLPVCISMPLWSLLFLESTSFRENLLPSKTLLLKEWSADQMHHGTWKVVRNTESWVAPQSCWLRTCISQDLQAIWVPWHKVQPLQPKQFFPWDRWTCSSSDLHLPAGDGLVSGSSVLWDVSKALTAVELF